MMRRLLNISLFAVILTFFITPLAFASAANEAGAAQLKSRLDGVLQEKKDDLSKSGITLSTSGDILVTPAEDSYKVTLPNLYLKNLKGEKVTDITFGAQNFIGDWDDKLDGFSKINAQYSDVKITDYLNKQTTSIQNATLSTISKALQKDWLSNVNLSLNNVVMTPENIVDPLLPQGATINIKMSDVPYNKLTDFTNEYLSGAKTANGFGVLQDFLKSFSDTNMNFVMENSNISSPLYKVNMDANLKSQANSNLGVAGVLNLNIEGLENSVKSLSTKRSQLNGAELDKLNNAINVLTILQLTSQKQGDSYVFKVAIDENSNVFVNGQDISALLVMSGL